APDSHARFDANPDSGDPARFFRRHRRRDRLFDTADPDDDADGKTWLDHLNPDSRRSVRGYLEPSLRDAAPEQHFQFERTGYFVADRHDHSSGAPVLNRTATLRDTWAQGAR